MSRCFPFPPPGYEKKARTDDVDLLIKDKHKEKKHKKEKKDKSKEGKEKKDKERGKDKDREKKERKEKHKDKKKSKDKKKTDEKKTEGQLDSYNGGKNSGNSSENDLQAAANKLTKPVEVGRRIEDEERGRRDQMVENQPAREQRSEKDYDNRGQGKENNKDRVGHDRKTEKQRVKDEGRVVGNPAVPSFSGVEQRSSVVQSFSGAEQRSSGVPSFSGVAQRSSGVPSFSGAEQRNSGVPSFSGAEQRSSGVPSFSGAEQRSSVAPSFSGATQRSSVVPCFSGMAQSSSVVPNFSGSAQGSSVVASVGSTARLEKDPERKKEGKKKKKDQEGNDKKGDKHKHKHRDGEKKSKEKNTEEEKLKEKKIKHENRKQDKLIEVPKDHRNTLNIKPIQIPKDSEKSGSMDENLRKRKDCETNGLLHDNDVRLNKLPRPTFSSPPPIVNGRKSELCQPATQFASAMHGGAKNIKVDYKEHKVNGLIQSQPTSLSSTNSSIPHVPSENGEASTKPPHPDSKYLNQIHSVPKMDDWSDFDEQEWLFSNDNLQVKKPKMVSSGVDGSPQVWDRALRIDSADVCALPYVIPY
ncbi:myb-like protein X [Thalictrum thalictroides]|uniref:Myb-like protein X n=1 Tax=Thalictrum thalictroides TaxID=46969 RepID=A0A7J6VI00_THATH|nr:myb-like protein X [Thalictrum thalictroides]